MVRSDLLRLDPSPRAALPLLLLIVDGISLVVRLPSILTSDLYACPISQCFWFRQIIRCDYPLSASLTATGFFSLRHTILACDSGFQVIRMRLDLRHDLHRQYRGPLDCRLLQVDELLDQGDNLHIE